MKLLFTMAHWHGLAKLRLHTDRTLEVLDSLTTTLGKQLREFASKTASKYRTEELPREVNSRKQRQGKDKSSDAGPGSSGSKDAGRRPKGLNLNTYKFHALGDYVETILTYGTTDSYSTEIVSRLNLGISFEG
jgi:hypothetical protein